MKHHLVACRSRNEYLHLQHCNDYPHYLCLRTVAPLHCIRGAITAHEGPMWNHTKRHNQDCATETSRELSDSSLSTSSSACRNTGHQRLLSIRKLSLYIRNSTDLSSKTSSHYELESNAKAFQLGHTSLTESQACSLQLIIMISCTPTSRCRERQ